MDAQKVRFRIRVILPDFNLAIKYDIKPVSQSTLYKEYVAWRENLLMANSQYCPDFVVCKVLEEKDIFEKPEILHDHLQ
jgi:hypothetical protein